MAVPAKLATAEAPPAEVIDKVAATLILQGALDRRRRLAPPEDLS